MSEAELQVELDEVKVHRAILLRFLRKFPLDAPSCADWKQKLGGVLEHFKDLSVPRIVLAQGTASGKSSAST